MTSLRAAALPETLPTFRNPQSFGTELEDLIKRQRELVQLGLSAKPKVELGQMVFPSTGDPRLVRWASESSFAERVFNSLVELKVSVSQYAMHLSPAARLKVFADLDDVLNVEDWHEDDVMPRLSSFTDFLKWTIYSKRFNWSSLGFSDEGSLIVAWLTDKGQLTARYDGAGRVWWTASIREDGEVNHAAGDASLEYFEREARRID